VKIVVVTQAYDPDHPYLGATHDWIGALARLGCRVDVVASWVKPGLRPPASVRVRPFGKARGAGRLERGALLHAQLARSVVGGRPDGVLAHMGPGFAIAAAPYAWLAGTPLVLWYAHKRVSAELRIAHALVDAVATASHDQLGIRGPKVRTLGHGVALDRFAPAAASANGRPPWRVLTVGRIAPVKRVDVVLDAADALAAAGRGSDFRLRLIGAPANAAHADYAAAVRRRAARLESVELVGEVPHSDMAGVYRRAHAYVSAYDGPGWDKATLEALASGLPCFVSGRTVRAELGDLDGHLGFATGQELADRLDRFFARPRAQRQRAAARCRSLVLGRHDVAGLMESLIGLFGELRDRRAAGR
jgi:glycosyltransferase involved in cell wall biosynthesis